MKTLEQEAIIKNRRETMTKYLEQMAYGLFVCLGVEVAIWLSHLVGVHIF